LLEKGGNEDDDAEVETTSGGEAKVFTLKAYLAKMRDFATYDPAVQTELFWHTLQLHLVETGGTGSKQVFSNRVKVLPALTAADYERISVLRKRLYSPPNAADPETHKLNKLAPLLKAYFGTACKPKLVHPVNSVPGSPSKLERGSPFIVAVTLNTARVVSMFEELKRLGTSKAQILKLYSHRTPASEQVKYLKADVRVVVGTPARLTRLASSGALSLARCELLIVDCFRDTKEWSVLTNAEVRDEIMVFWSQIAAPHVLGTGPAAAGAHTKIIFF